MTVLDKKYLALSVSAALSGMSIGIKALGVSATAILIKVGVETFCERFKPTGVMDAREQK